MLHCCMANVRLPSREKRLLLFVHSGKNFWDIMLKNFSDCILIRIFHWLEIKELITCCYVCSRWKRIVYDSSLWTDVDLCPFQWKLDEQLIIRLVHSRFCPCLRKLNLTGFSLTPKLFTELELTCPNLRTLILENVTFIGFNECDVHTYKFPSKLDVLDIRYSGGDPAAYDLIMENLPSVKSIGITNTLLMRVNNVCLVKNLTNVCTLDFSHCNALYDATLILIGTFCSSLVSLSLNHCNNVVGRDLCMITRVCRNLKALSFNGTSLTDESLLNCNWENVELEELDISWCRHITEQGLIAILPHLTKLLYLRLCSCGFGHAITDDVLTALWSFQHLQILDVSYSREISNNTVSKTIRILPSLKQIRINCCRKLTPELLNLSTSDKSVLVLASFREQAEYKFSNENSLYAGSGTNKLKISLTTSGAQLRKHSLENAITRS